MQGAIAIVTGATSGIGEEVAKRLAAAGARVVIAGRHRVRLERVVSEIRKPGGEAHPVEVDLATDTGPSSLVEAAIQRFGTIDALVHSAGIYEPQPLASLSATVLDRMWAINVRAPLRLTQFALPYLSVKGGSVTFISSISGHVGFANEAAYAGTKAAIEGMTRALAVELAPSRIRVNCVAPGFTATPMNEAIRAAGHGAVNSAVACTLAARLGTPEDIGAAVAFLCSDAARYIYGVVLPVDGGYPTSAIQAGLV